MSQFFIQINDRGGQHFRKYTRDSLIMLFDTSPTAANFELMILIEGLTFLALRTHFIISNNEKAYEVFLRKNDRLEGAVAELSAKK